MIATLIVLEVTVSASMVLWVTVWIAGVRKGRSFEITRFLVYIINSTLEGYFHFALVVGGGNLRDSFRILLSE